VAADSASNGPGFGRPPKRTQFQKGTSGNPRGRPKRKASFKADLADEMHERITLNDKNGRPQKITKQRAFIKMLFASALQNEKSAITALLACMKYFGAGDEVPEPEIGNVEDLEMVKDYVERTEARIKHEADAAAQSKSRKSKGGK
jgi:hypothetical protein